MRSDINLELSEEQKDVIPRAIYNLESSKNTIVSLPTGAGKSRIAIEIINALSAKMLLQVLIIVPRKLLSDSVWQVELRKWAHALYKNTVSVDGRKEPSIRDTFWSNVIKYNYLVIATPNTISRDIENGLVNINTFGLIILDEAHHSIKKEGDSYSISKVYSFLKQYKNKVLGLTIADKVPMQLVDKTGELLNAKVITSKFAKEKKLDKIVIKLQNSQRERIEKIINEEIGRMIAIFKSKYPAFSGFPFGNIDYTIKRYGISTSSSEANKLRIQNARYNKLRTLNRFVEEDNIDHIKNVLLGDNTTGVYQKIAEALIGYEKIKLNELLNVVNVEVSNGRPVIVFTAFRDSAEMVYKILKSKMTVGIMVGGLYEDPSFLLDKYMEEGVSVLVATMDMAGEGLNLQYFRTIVLCSGINSEFKKLQLEGRIRGGRIIQLIYLGAPEKSLIIS